MMWRTGLVVAFIVAAAVMAYQIGSRLSNEAIMTIVGVACGIGASIPVSIGLLIALTRERTTYNAPEEYIEPEPAPTPYNVYRAPNPPQPTLTGAHTTPSLSASQQPQIIVIAPPQQQLPQNFAPYGNYLQPPALNALPPPMQERNFKIVGEDDDE